MILGGVRGHLRRFLGFERYLSGFASAASERASAASEASGAMTRQTQHEAAGSSEKITRFPFLIKTGFIGRKAGG